MEENPLRKPLAVVVMTSLFVVLAVAATAGGQNYCEQTWKNKCHTDKTTTTTVPETTTTTVPEATTTTATEETTTTIPETTTTVADTTTVPAPVDLKVTVDCKYITVEGGEFTFVANGADTPTPPSPPLAPGTYKHSSAPGHGWAVYDVYGNPAASGVIPECDPVVDASSGVLPFTGSETVIYLAYALVLLASGGLFMRVAKYQD